MAVEYFCFSVIKVYRFGNKLIGRIADSFAHGTKKRIELRWRERERAAVFLYIKNLFYLK